MSDQIETISQGEAVPVRDTAPSRRKPNVWTSRVIPLAVLSVVGVINVAWIGLIGFLVVSYVVRLV